MSDLTEQEIDVLIERAGLTDVMDVFYSAIEVNTNLPHPSGTFWNGYRALAALLRLYGDERAREIREQAVQAALKRASEWSDIKERGADPRWTAKWQEASDLMALISDLPLS